MKILVIPDVHLKPWLFQRAETLMTEGRADRAVCLMDIADNWGMEFFINLYEDTYDAAIRFAEKFPDTLWCYGNHDLCYVWNRRERVFCPGVIYSTPENERTGKNGQTRGKDRICPQGR